LENSPPLISVQNLHKTFAAGQRNVPALRGLTLAIQEQEFLSIVGASGAGKSTLLHILGTLDRPSQGSVYYRGTDIFSRSNKRLAEFRNQKIGFVFQLHHLLPEFTALENAMMPALIRGLKKRVAKEKAASLLAKIGLEDRMHHKPGELSGGEQQRVAIARALLLKPEMILADEPTGSLDSMTGNLIFDMLRTLNQEEKIAMVLVTHNERLAALAPRCITLKDGGILSDVSSS